MNQAALSAIEARLAARDAAGARLAADALLAQTELPMTERVAAVAGVEITGLRPIFVRPSPTSKACWR